MMIGERRSTDRVRPGRGREILRPTTDRLASWLRFAAILTVIVVNGIFREAWILGAEFMMLVRWTRDVLRYEVRWIVQEKARLLSGRRARPGSK
jgi:hypothetical protein